MSTLKVAGSTWEVTGYREEDGVTVTAVGKWRGEASSFTLTMLNAEPDSIAYLAKLEGTYNMQEIQGFGFNGTMANYQRGSFLGAITARVWKDLDTGEVKGWSVYSRHYSDGWSEPKRKAIYTMIEHALNELDLLSAEAMDETERALIKRKAESIQSSANYLRLDAARKIEEAEQKEAEAQQLLDSLLVTA